MVGRKREDWSLADALDTAAITTKKVLDGQSSLLVTDDEEDGCWSFLCGTTNKSSDGRVIGVAEALDLDPTLTDVAELPICWHARRTNRSSSWIREQSRPAEQEP